MDLNSPRKDPYSQVSHAEEDLKQKGFTTTLTVKDDHTAKIGDSSYPVDQLSVFEMHRVPDEENNNRGTMVVGIVAEDGSRGLLKTPFGENGEETVQNFLRKVESDESPNAKY